MPAPASVQVSMRPKRGVRICAVASPAAAHVPMQRLQVTSSPIACSMSAGLNGALLVGLPRVAFDERLANEARDVVPGDRARRLERRHRKRRQIEPGLVARVAVEQARDASGHREPAGEDAHDPGVRFVRRAYLGSFRSRRPWRLPLAQMAEFKTNASYRPTGDQPTAVATLAEGLEAGDRMQTLRRGDGYRKDRDDGLDDREGRPPGAHHRAQQDACRAALQRVPRVLPGQRRRVLRLLLRLLPAGGVRASGRPLHREGLIPERRHRAAQARGDVGALHPSRRSRRRLGLLPSTGSARPRSGASG